MKEFKNVCMFFGADEGLSMDAFEEASDSPFAEAEKSGKIGGVKPVDI